MCKPALLLNLILISPVFRRNSVKVLECSGKMQLVCVAYSTSYIFNGKLRQLQKLPRLCHAVGQKKVLGRFADSIVEDLSEIAAVQAAESGNILYSNIILKILFNKC